MRCGVGFPRSIQLWVLGGSLFFALNEYCFSIREKPQSNTCREKEARTTHCKHWCNVRHKDERDTDTEADEEAYPKKIYLFGKTRALGQVRKSKGSADDPDKNAGPCEARGVADEIHRAENDSKRCQIDADSKKQFGFHVKLFFLILFLFFSKKTTYVCQVLRMTVRRAKPCLSFCHGDLNHFLYAAAQDT